MQVGFETEGTAIFDTMQYVTNEVHPLTCFCKCCRPCNSDAYVPAVLAEACTDLPSTLAGMISGGLKKHNIAGMFVVLLLLFLISVTCPWLGQYAIANSNLRQI